MRYGKITQFYAADHPQTFMNVGDIVQTIAIESLYEAFGVPANEVVGVSKYELSSYQGEKLILPITGFFNERPDMGEIPFSEHIAPIFLGYHLGWGLYDDGLLQFFKRHEPIGCRDAYSRRAFEARGVAAYVCGCPTIILPRRPKDSHGEKVFLVDIPAELEEFIPELVARNAERLSHIVPLEKVPLQEAEYRQMVEYTRTLLGRYRDEARLVVTGRIHCALPCLAMGIPVIFATRNLHETHEFLGNMTRIYTADDFHAIDWAPAVVDLEAVKRDFLQLASASLRHAYALADAGVRLNAFHSFDSGKVLHQKEVSKLLCLFSDKHGEYIIWGVGALGSKVYQLMQDHLPRVNLRVCCDSFAEQDFFGRSVLRPSQLPSPEDGLKILAATSYDIAKVEIHLEQLGYCKGANYESMLVHPGMK